MSISQFDNFVNPVLLCDYNESTGVLYDWLNFKKESLKVKDSYVRIYNHVDKDLYPYRDKFFNRIDKIYNCSNYLEFKNYFDDNSKKLHKAYFCKDRLCPGCIKRRSMKIFGQVKQVISHCESDYEFLFLTLTVKNCDFENLNDTVSHMFKSWKKFFEKKKIKNSIRGWYRSLEITFDHDEFISQKKYDKSKKYYDRLGLIVGDLNPNYQMFHPHFHIILAVDKNYYKSRDYLTKNDFMDLWRDSLGVDYSPVVDIRKVKSKNEKLDDKDLSNAVAEVAKYTVKSTDYIIDSNLDLSDLAIYHLAISLSNRRLIAFGGVLKKIHKLLNLDDALDGDLVNTDNEIDDESRPYNISVFSYGFGAFGDNYYLSDLKLPETLDLKEEFKTLYQDQKEFSKNKISDVSKFVDEQKKISDRLLAEKNGDSDLVKKHITDNYKNKNIKSKIKYDDVIVSNDVPATFDLKTTLRLFSSKKISYLDLTYLNYYIQNNEFKLLSHSKLLDLVEKNLSSTDNYHKRCVLIDLRNFLERI